MTTYASVAARLFSAQPLSLVLTAAILGAAYTLYLFPFHFLIGSSPFWDAPPIPDLEQLVTGARYYIGDEWRFPVLRTAKVDPPGGIVIVFTDSVPLFAVLAKLLKGVSGASWNYFGTWLGVCYVMQAVSIVILLVSLGIRNYIVSIAAVAIALSAPALLFRLFHVPLSAHFLVILALAFYFASMKTLSFRRIWPWFCVLVWMALWVQAYFFVMILTIFFGTAVQAAFIGKSGWQQAGLAVGVCVAGALCLMWASGFFWGRAEVKLWDIGRTVGFGEFSMNLLSPLVPQWSGLFPGLAAVFGATAGSWEEVVIDATGGQYEGFQYLGAGVLFLAGIALWLDGKDVMRRATKYWGLLMALLILTILSITHRVYMGMWNVTLLDEVPLLLDEIRSSGRLFLPVGYTIMAAAIAIVALHSRGYIGAGLLLVAAAVQAADVAPIRSWARDWVVYGYWDAFTIPPTPWVDLIRHHEKMEVFPIYECSSESWRSVIDLGFHASASLTPVNTIYLNRFKDVDCEAEVRSVGHMEVEEGDLLVLLEPQYIEAFAAGNSEYRQLCRSFDEGIVCSREWPAVDQEGWGWAFERF